MATIEVFSFHSNGIFAHNRLDHANKILGRIDPILVAQSQELVAAFIEKRNRELALMQLQQRLQLQELIRLLAVSRDLDEHALRLRLSSAQRGALGGPLRGPPAVLERRCARRSAGQPGAAHDP